MAFAMAGTLMLVNTYFGRMAAFDAALDDRCRRFTRCGFAKRPLFLDLQRESFDAKTSASLIGTARQIDFRAEEIAR